VLFLSCEKDSSRCYLVLMSLSQKERGKVSQVLSMDGGRAQDQSFSIMVTCSTFSPVWVSQVGCYCSHKYGCKSSNRSKELCMGWKASSQKGQASLAGQLWRNKASSDSGLLMYSLLVVRHRLTQWWGQFHIFCYALYPDLTMQTHNKLPHSKASC